MADKTAADKKAILDDGGKLEDKEADFWEQRTEAQKRLLAILPTMIHEALAQLCEKHGHDIAPDTIHFLNLSASKALFALPHPHAAAVIVQKDAQSFLAHTSADDGRHAAMCAAYLTLQLAEQGLIPATEECQAVLCSAALMEEAKADEDHVWHMNAAKVAKGAAALRERLEFHNYIVTH